MKKNSERIISVSATLIYSYFAIHVFIIGYHEFLAGETIEQLAITGFILLALTGIALLSSIFTISYFKSLNHRHKINRHREASYYESGHLELR